MDHLDQLESKSIYILREAHHAFPNLAMLWSVGKDSTVLLRLAQKAFFGHVPFPLIHIDTSYKIPEMIAYRDALALKWKLEMIVGQNRKALKERKTFPCGKVSRIDCCKLLKTKALREVLSEGERFKLNHETKKYKPDPSSEPFTGLILGIRADEEGSRSKERIFSPRNLKNEWDTANQPPEFWDQYNTEFPKGTHARIHPLLDWTELNVWQYIKREKIPIVKLYFNQECGTRYRSLGCAPCTNPISSTSSNIPEIVNELQKGRLTNIAERSGRAQDEEDGGGLEDLRKDGYM